uniref:MEKHLA domain-containing protein n=1 Tax=Schlesneria paludicola TaxID=360056 RepID=A0A7C2K1W2_9PLAN
MSRDSIPAPWNEARGIEHARMLLDSYRHWLGRELLPRSGIPERDAVALFFAPFVVVSHGVETDPILNYGNRAALTLWEMEIPQLLQTPSRLTAEPVHRDERARLLARTTRDGYVDDYQGVRISATGKRFRIERAIVWNLIDPAGQYAGQAATFSEWTWLPTAQA